MGFTDEPREGEFLKRSQTPIKDVQQDVYLLIKVPVFGTQEHVRKLRDSLKRSLQVSISTQVSVFPCSEEQAQEFFLK